MYNSSTIAFIWSLFEGLFFFIVPDVGLSYIALKGPKQAGLGVFFSVIGSMLASALLYVGLDAKIAWFESLPALWQHLPGYYERMLNLAAIHLQESGAHGLLRGPTSGVPYRFYIFEAWHQHIDLWNLELWTPAARLQRIFLAPTVVLILNWLCPKIPYFKTRPQQLRRALVILITLYWIGIYTWYWGFFLPKTYAG